MRCTLSEFHKAPVGVGVAWVTWPNSAHKGRIAYLPADVTSKVNDMFTNKNKTANIKGKN